MESSVLTDSLLGGEPIEQRSNEQVLEGHSFGKISFCPFGSPRDRRGKTREFSSAGEDPILILPLPRVLYKIKLASLAVSAYQSVPLAAPRVLVLVAVFILCSPSVHPAAFPPTSASRAPAMSLSRPRRGREEEEDGGPDAAEWSTPAKRPRGCSCPCCFRHQ